MEPIWQSIKDSKKSLFRFEGLQDYSAEDGDEWVKKFIETGILAETPNDSNEWWRDMKKRNQKGVVTQRVRMVTKPLTNYTKMELAYLKEAKKYSGDDIRIINQADFNQVAPGDLKDFWMIDDEHVFLMDYGPKGKYLRSNETSDFQKYFLIKEKLIQAGTPL